MYGGTFDFGSEKIISMKNISQQLASAIKSEQLRLESTRRQQVNKVSIQIAITWVEKNTRHIKPNFTLRSGCAIHLKEGCGKNALYLILSKKQKFVFERKNFHERNSVANSRHAFYKFKDLSCVTVPSRGQQVSYCLLKLPWRFVYMGQKKVRPDKPYVFPFLIFSSPYFLIKPLFHTHLWFGKKTNPIYSPEPGT